MRPALRRILNSVLVPHLSADKVVLEVGAGSGEMSLLMAGMLPRGCQWLGTDQAEGPGLTVATLPELREVADGAIDVITELSVADAIPHPVLVDSFAGMWRVLKPGGVFVRILDLREQSAILGPDAAREGLLPMLYTHNATDDKRHFSRVLVLLDRERLRSQLPALRREMTSPAGANAIESWLSVPDGVLSNEDAPERRNHLLALFRKLNVVSAEMDLAVYAQARLKDALPAANLTRDTGFETAFCESVTEEAMVKRKTLAGFPNEATAVASRYGLMRIWVQDPFGPHRDNLVRIRSTAIVLVGRKPPRIS